MNHITTVSSGIFYSTVMVDGWYFKIVMGPLFGTRASRAVYDCEQAVEDMLTSERRGKCQKISKAQDLH